MVGLVGFASKPAIIPAMTLAVCHNRSVQRSSAGSDTYRADGAVARHVPVERRLASTSAALAFRDGIGGGDCESLRGSLGNGPMPALMRSSGRISTTPLWENRDARNVFQKTRCTTNAREDSDEPAQQGHEASPRSITPHARLAHA